MVADKYVRNTVLLATVLFLVALAQRFGRRGLRIGVNAGAFVMLVYVVGSTATLPTPVLTAPSARWPILLASGR